MKHKIYNLGDDVVVFTTSNRKEFFSHFSRLAECKPAKGIFTEFAKSNVIPSETIGEFYNGTKLRYSEPRLYEILSGMGYVSIDEDFNICGVNKIFYILPMMREVSDYDLAKSMYFIVPEYREMADFVWDNMDRHLKRSMRGIEGPNEYSARVVIGDGVFVSHETKNLINAVYSAYAV